VSIENISGSQWEDVLRGDAGNNVLYGGTLNDILDGRDGNDRLDGGSSLTSILYGPQPNMITDGNDALTGGTGSDTFVFHAGFNHDTVSDFESGVDVIEFDGMFADYAAFQAGSLMMDSGADVVITIGANTLTLKDIHAANLQQSDFLFA
jgi:Ca2+-binding RTX toxin-like protein